MARVKNMSEAKKANIHVLWEVGRIQNKVALQEGCSQFGISKIRRTCRKRFNCSSKPETSKDEHQQKRIFISNRLANCSEISKAGNDAGVSVSSSITLRKLWI